MKKAGSVTVFFVLLLVLMTSAIFAFLEAARVHGLHTQAGLSTRQAADTVRASYQPELWKQYHILFWREPGGGENGFRKMNALQTEQIEKNWKLEKSTVNFFVLPIHMQSIEVKKYELATDDQGYSFRSQAVAWTRQSLAEDAVKEVWKVVTGADEKQLEQSGSEAEQKTEYVLEQLGGEETEESVPETCADTGTDTPKELSGQENPLEWIKKVKKKGILSVVIPEKELSENRIDRSGCLEQRKLRQGNWKAEQQNDEMNAILFQLYCKAHFSDATQNNRNTAGNQLQYEMEYLIGGKSSDIENLKVTVNRLLLLREGANLLYLEGNPEKSQQAFQMALTITSAMANPELAEPVKQAVLAAWAYAESISDVRILLNGGKVPLVKTDAQWHTDLQNPGNSIQKAEYDQEQTGLSYAGYIQILLKTTGKKNLTFRAMDLIEKNLNLQMDEMISKAESIYQFETNALFWNFVRIGNTDIHKLQIQESGVISFYE